MIGRTTARLAAALRNPGALCDRGCRIRLKAGLPFLVVGLLECAVAESVRRGALGVPWALVLHLGLVVWLASVLRKRARPGRTGVGYLAFGLMVAFLGPPGLVGALVFSGFSYLFGGGRTTSRAWHEALLPAEESSSAGEIVNRIEASRDRSSGSADVRPFIDLLERGTTVRKQAIISIMARNYHQTMAPMLRRAQVDPDPAVRVLAASATASIEQQFTDRWLELESRVEAVPSDSAVHRALARHLDNYAFSGIPSRQRAEEIRSQALGAYRDCLALEPGMRDVKASMGRLLLRMGQVAEALEVFSELLPEYEAEDRSAVASIRFYHAECLFRLGRYRELQSSLRSCGSDWGRDDAVPERIRSLARLWCTGGDDELAEAP